MTLRNVLYTPKLKANILSLGCLDEQGCQITHGKGVLTIRDENGRLLTTIKRSSGRLNLLKLYTMENCLQIREDATWKWHQRYGHHNFDSLISLSSKNMVRGLPIMHKVNKLCHECVHSKQSRSSFPSQSSYGAEKPLELIHDDLCGPIEPETLGRSKYFLLLVDDCTRMMWTSMLRQKSDALEAFQRFQVVAESESSLKIKTLRTDHGGEFNSKTFFDFYLHSGIKRQLSAPYSPQQNGVVERRNIIILNMVRSMLKGKKFTSCFLGRSSKHLSLPTQQKSNKEFRR